MNRLRSISIIIGITCCIGSAVTLAAPRCAVPVATVEAVEGDVRYRAADTNWQALQRNVTLCSGDAVKTGANSRAALVIQPDKTLTRLDAHSYLKITGVAADTSIITELFEGAAYFISRITRQFIVKTAYANTYVEGTEFLVTVDAEQTRTTVFEGIVRVQNPLGQTSVAVGQTAITRANRAPVIEQTINPQDAVQWTLHYPPIIDIAPGEIQLQNRQAQTQLDTSINTYHQGKITQALAIAKSLPNTPEINLYRATLYLRVGRVPEANQALRQVPEDHPAYSSAIAIRAMIAISNNQNEYALTLAKKAVDLDSNNLAARLALSYAYQANFELDKAQKILEDVLFGLQFWEYPMLANLTGDTLSDVTPVQIAPAPVKARQRALVMARQSELHLIQGEFVEALEIAEQLVKRYPNLARPHLVLGYAKLANSQPEHAQQHFKTAIARDNSLALARLGLGLATIRRGQLEQGRAQIEIAALLAPQNALIRNYLGKAYLQENRTERGLTEIELAQQFDPKDPTSAFFRAIHAQNTNQPVVAFRELQNSKALNDNRSIYRNENFIAQDLAARSANLARVYEDLGFSQLALQEGYQSLLADPSNHSAHDFLAQAYSQLPRHEIAQVSEQFQAQLNQPYNYRPRPPIQNNGVQAALSTGDFTQGFNEYSPFFIAQGVHAQANVLTSNHNTLGSNAVLYGLHNGVSYQLGSSYFETDGRRENNDSQQHANNAFIQINPRQDTSVQLEYNQLRQKEGYISEDFSEDLNIRQKTQRRDLRVEGIRLGFNHHINKQSQVLGNLSKQFSVENQSFKFNHALLGEGESFVNDRQEPISAELQYLFANSWLKVVVGLSRFDDSRKQNTTTALEESFTIDELPTMAGEPAQPVVTKVQHNSGYLYTTFYNNQKNLHVMLGFSVDNFKEDVIKLNKFNPKFGFLWTVTNNLNFRASATRVVKRSLINNQTIEPTQTAGFNQFFDDLNGSISKRYGVGLDYRVADNIFVGAELSRRSISVPFRDNGLVNFVGETEYFYQHYLYWAINENLTLSATYQLSLLDNHESIRRQNNDTLNAKTQVLPFALKYFDSSGLFVEAISTYVNQQVDSVKNTGGTSVEGFMSGKDAFWLFGLKAGYRFIGTNNSIVMNVSNLFNQSFSFQGDNLSQNNDPRRSTFSKERTVTAIINLGFW